MWSGRRHTLDYDQLQQRFRQLPPSALPQMLPPDLCSQYAQTAAALQQSGRGGDAAQWISPSRPLAKPGASPRLRPHARRSSPRG